MLVYSSNKLVTISKEYLLEINWLGCLARANNII